jgi:oligopeptide/dipeptide ABC transporter ATP-binding protein
VSAASPALLEVEGLVTSFPLKGGGRLRAVDGVDLAVDRGETLAVVGESGCGKSTLARSVLRLVEPAAGRVRFAGEDVLALGREALRRRRRDMQLVFQDPMASLDPRFTVGRSLAEPFAVHGIGTPTGRRDRVAELLRLVGLDSGAAERYPHEFSGGQRQRVGIARAIALEPRLVVLDEPVSALDVSIQSQILNLLLDLKERLGLSYLFISHDLGVVRAIADRVAVMYLGRVVETAPVERLFGGPAHPYAQALLAAVPRPDPAHRQRRAAPVGEPPDPARPPPGCPFHPRCPRAMAVCRATMPERIEIAAGHAVRCHLYP